LIGDPKSEPWSNTPLHMPTTTSTAGWYFGTREEFLETNSEVIAGKLASRANEESLDIEAAQQEEWLQSVNLLQKSLSEKIPILKEALIAPGGEKITGVILEYDFRRRGLRMDCLLLGEGILFVVEFKRSKFQRADRDQVMNYAVNLLEFHKATQEWCEKGLIIVPILSLTQGDKRIEPSWNGIAGHSWKNLATLPLECDQAHLKEALRLGLEHRQSNTGVSLEEWINSPFRPSSSILDATLSLFGNHDVAAIQEHQAPKESIDRSIQEIREIIQSELAAGSYHIVFLSGSPGAGKTLVGLDLVMRGAFANEAVFVTGNAPLVDVLNKALDKSYKRQSSKTETWTPTGYRRSDARFVAGAASYKVVKAHNFLGNRGITHRQEDGRVLVFDEAQRTYEQGRQVLGEALVDHEADLILKVQRNAYPEGGAVIVALIGHNQAINRGERGVAAWMEAAERLGWTYSISNETLTLALGKYKQRWATNPNRRDIQNGHLHQSIRYYRNDSVEHWASALLEGNAEESKRLATKMSENGHPILMTRSLNDARSWVRPKTLGGMRAGIIASGQAKRLSAEGLFVDYKPDIATWMLAPSTHIKASNALETVQNQYQIQGLELDYCIVCWDADLRRENNAWKSYKISGSDWNEDRLPSKKRKEEGAKKLQIDPLEIAKNGYRVILTRARKGMIIFVPQGDLTGLDTTRRPAYYDSVADYLIKCGVRLL
jgi:hypothetical protein